MQMESWTRKECDYKSVRLFTYRMTPDSCMGTLDHESGHKGCLDLSVVAKSVWQWHGSWKVEVLKSTNDLGGVLRQGRHI